MIGGFTRRGQPLLALMLLLGGWVSARAMMWEARPLPHLARAGAGAEAARPEPALGLSKREALGHGVAPSRPADLSNGQSIHLAAAQPAAPLSSRNPGPPDAAMPADLPPPPAVLPPAPAPAFTPTPVRTAIGHNLLWMAALARVPMPAGLPALPNQSGPEPRLAPLAAPAGPAAGVKRWSADGWVLWRRGSLGAATGGLLTPSYGASQTGAVVRYRLAPSSAHRPAAYLRATAALNGSSEREAALGLQLRPVAALPLALLGEARVTAVPGRTSLRPAVFAVTELPPFSLPLGLRGEVYGQAGYVGGRGATAFADGQLRFDRRLAGLGKGDVRLGGGLWGGAQKGASRLDAGPTLTLGQPLGGTGSMRLAADWRFRVAGKAAPGSGPAVTLSAGF